MPGGRPSCLDSNGTHLQNLTLEVNEYGWDKKAHMVRCLCATTAVLGLIWQSCSLGRPQEAEQACTAATCTMMSMRQPHRTEAAPLLQIFVDQPINTGFSFSNDSRDRVYDETVVAADMLDFLQAFFKAHPGKCLA